MTFSLAAYKPKFAAIKRKQDSLNQLIGIMLKPSSKTHGLIIQGSPGVGKSHQVEQYLTQNSIKHTTIKGTITPTRLFGELLDRRNVGEVMVLDDSDSALDNEDGLNILKAATDTTPIRKISRSLSKRISPLDGLDATGSFNFQGAVIIITNQNFDNSPRKAIRPHLAALKSRCMHVQTDNGSRDEAFAQIVYTVVEQGMLNDYKISTDAKTEVLGYLHDNLAVLKDCSLRTVQKLAELVQDQPDTWRILADFTFISQE
jgi:hypothetical protein